jgi:beta-N-acetylhexosaminidase
MEERTLGGLFLVGFQGTILNLELRDFLEDLNPAGVVLFARNIEGPVQVARLTHQLQTHARELGRDGLIIGVDQEGGRVNRLREPFPVFPPALELAGAPDPESAVRDFARVTASELRTLGINLDFVPVMDVPERPWDARTSVIGDRAFGADPADVARFGLVVVETMRSEGIIPCCKHFPGHGGTLVDSHRDLPMDPRSRQDLLSRDLVPFARAIQAGVEMIMTAHVLYPALDPELPATLSPAIVRGLLHGEMGFPGVTVTDDLDMDAIAARYSVEDYSVRAVAAGADLLMFCNHPEKAFAARTALMDGVRRGEIPAARIEESLGRVSSLAARFTASRIPCDVAEVVRRYSDMS